MDRFTIRNLELLHNGDEQAHSLLKSIDATLTPMGARLIKRWLIFHAWKPGLLEMNKLFFLTK
jgi:DNA mismatch repair protein MutS